jgi:hypothetical protein
MRDVGVHIIRIGWEAGVRPYPRPLLETTGWLYTDLFAGSVRELS